MQPAVLFGLGLVARQLLLALRRLVRAAEQAHRASLGGANGARERARYQPRLAGRDERAAAVETECRARRLGREGAQARPAEIAIVAA